MPNHSRQEKMDAFGRLLDIMDTLRAECPWDKKQTLESLRILTIEETYELADAITAGDKEELKGEIGDLLLHMVFYAKIADEQGAFDIADALEYVNAKLIRRHPHIYSDVKVTGEEEVKRNWEQIKLAEGKKSVLEGVPKSLPAMVKAYRVQDKAKQVGFEWETAEGVLDKVAEELNELQDALANGDTRHAEEEMGDVLFSIINYARFVGIDPEGALERTNQKFIRRFQYMEQHTKSPLSSLRLEEMEELWTAAKQTEKEDSGETKG